MNGAEAIQLLKVVAMLWPSVPIVRDERLQAIVWQRMLADVTYAEAEALVTDMARSGEHRFPPGPGDVYRSVLDLRDEVAGRTIPTVDEALAEVLRAIRRRGLSQGPPKEWSHPAIGAAVEAMTWRDLCLSTNPEATRAHFFRVYETARTRAVRLHRRSPEVRQLIAGMREGLAPGAIGELDRPAD